MNEHSPFLFQFLEEESSTVPNMEMELNGMATNPKEEEPRPEPTKKTPYGD